jgi:hypothetical protein
MPRIKQIVGKAASEGDPSGELKTLQDYLAGGEAMIVHARMGRALVGFLVLDSSNGAAPFSWVDQRFRHQGLGERFYSFACINLARPAPEFRFHRDMLEEYGGVLKSVGLMPTLRDSFYVLHGGGAPAAAGDQGPPALQAPAQAPETSAAAHLRESNQRPAARGLVIDDGQWIGFSQFNARRLKLRLGRFPRLVEP